MDGLKRCLRCQVERPVVNFWPDRRRPDGYYAYCKDCASAMRMSSYYKNWAREQALARKTHLKKKYGITPADYDRMFAEHGGLCAICRKPGTPVHQKVRYPLYVDHDHATNRVRGLLCYYCNTLLQKAGESIQVLDNAIDYLVKYGKEPAQEDGHNQAPPAA